MKNIPLYEAALNFRGQLVSWIVSPYICCIKSLLTAVSCNCSLQLKKLVYVYLVRYAEEQQDLALLSISTFQRALKVTLLITVFAFLIPLF